MTDAKAVYRRLRDEILSGALPPGSPLREIPLASKFGVSRTPVREALRRLEHDRLLVPGDRGMIVRAIHPHEVIQIYEMRIVLEAEAAGHAARDHRTADLVTLEGLLERDQSLVNPEDAIRIRTNLEFHTAVWHATHNPVLVDLLERLTTHLVHVPHSTLSVGNRWSDALDEHARLIAAIRERDEPNARAIAAQHMTTAQQIRLRLLRDAAVAATDAGGQRMPLSPAR
jgi:DNA-binding GntR family transcriptional regulator